VWSERLDQLQRGAALQRDPRQTLTGRGHPRDVAREVAGHPDRGPRRVQVVPPAGALQLSRAPLSETHPHPPGALQVRQIRGPVVGGLVLNAGVRSHRADPFQSGRVIAQHSPKGHQVGVEIVHGFHSTRRLRQQHREGASERLDIMGVRRE